MKLTVGWNEHCCCRCVEYQFAFLKSPTAKASPVQCPELFMPGKSPTKCSVHYDDHLQSFFFALFMIYRFLKHLPRLWSDLSLKEVLLRSTLALPH